MAAKTRKWDEIYNNLDALTQEDRDEIALKVKSIGQILEARKEKGLTQAELEAILIIRIWDLELSFSQRILSKNKEAEHGSRKHDNN